jgi:hypothetical protein
MFRLGAAVPEATIHKDRQSLTTKDKVGLTEQRNFPSPASNTEVPKQRDHPKLGVSIPTSPNTSHYEAAFVYRENVSHLVCIGA